MSSKLKVLQVIPKLGYGGAETGCYDLAHYLHEQNAKSYIVTSGGPLLKYIDKKKVKLIRLPVQSKNPILIFCIDPLVPKTLPRHVGTSLDVTRHSPTPKTAQKLFKKQFFQNTSMLVSRSDKLTDL